ncbi:MAG: DUF4019 domain-containing protein [Sphingomonadaceae bacterium]
MTSGIDLLTDREAETLRLLVRGYDAKSAARELGLSVHTINDRLRQARRKLGVTSSREAARMLAEHEDGTPEKLAGKNFGMACDAARSEAGPETGKVVQKRRTWLWIAGGIAVILASMAALVLSGLFNPTPQVEANLEQVSQASESEALPAALRWVALVDEGDWRASWRTSGQLFNGKVTLAQWTKSITPVRPPLGAVRTRNVQSVRKTRSLPGAPAGQYELLELKTDFANKRGAIETVVMAKEPTGWKVVGYFIR